MTAALLVVVACVVALLGVLVADRSRPPLRVPDRLDVEPTRALVGTAPDGGTVAIEPTGHGDRTLLAFLTSTCVTCRVLWTAFGDDLPARLPIGTRVVIVTEDAAVERMAAVRDLAPLAVGVVMSSATWHRYGVSVAPTFVVVDGASGLELARGTAASDIDVVRLVQRTTRS